MFEDCIRCSEAPAVDELGYCGHCHWLSRSHVAVERNSVRVGHPPGGLV